VTNAELLVQFLRNSNGIPGLCFFEDLPPRGDYITTTVVIDVTPRMFPERGCETVIRWCAGVDWDT
jgi:hypothetical protein